MMDGSTSQERPSEVEVGALDATPALQRRAIDNRDMVSVREDVLATAAAAAGFVAGAGGVGAALGLPLRAVGLGRRTPALKGSRMRNRKLNAQLAPAMYSLAATNAQLLGLVGRRHPVLGLAKFGVAAAGIAFLTADEAQRKAILDQATGLIEQGGNALANSGLLEKVFK
jgi:hypothetical protein